MSTTVTLKPAIQPSGTDRTDSESARRIGDAKRTYPKTHANYWRSRLKHRTYGRDDKTFEVA